MSVKALPGIMFGWLTLPLAAFAQQPPPPAEERSAVLFDLRIVAWRGTADGWLEGDSSTVDGDRLQADGDLGLDEPADEFTPEVTLILSMESMDIRAWLTIGELEFEADTVLSRSFTYEGLAYTAGDAAQTKLDIEYAIIGAEMTWVTSESREDRSYAFLTLEGGVEGFAARSEIRTAANQDGTTVYGLYGWVGVRAGWQVQMFSGHVFGRVGPILEYGAEAQIQFGHLVLIGGWRWAEFHGLDVEGDEVEHAQLEISGAYVGIELRY